LREELAHTVSVKYMGRVSRHQHGERDHHISRQFESVSHTFLTSETIMSVENEIIEEIVRKCQNEAYETKPIGSDMFGKIFAVMFDGSIIVTGRDHYEVSKISAMLNGARKIAMMQAVPIVAEKVAKEVSSNLKTKRNGITFH